MLCANCVAALPQAFPSSINLPSIPQKRASNHCELETHPNISTEAVVFTEQD